MGVTNLTMKELEMSLVSMATHMFREGVTWSKVASFFNLVSAAAEECIHKVGRRKQQKTTVQGPPRVPSPPGGGCGYSGGGADGWLDSQPGGLERGAARGAGMEGDYLLLLHSPTPPHWIPAYASSGSAGPCDEAVMR